MRIRAIANRRARPTSIAMGRDNGARRPRRRERRQWSRSAGAVEYCAATCLVTEALKPPRLDRPEPRSSAYRIEARMNAPRYAPGIEIIAQPTPESTQILTPDAVAFAARLQRAFGPR